MVYNADMASEEIGSDYPPAPRWAVYYGTITLDDGTPQTYTASEVAALYNLGGADYLAVPLIGPSPFLGGVDEVSYYHLKPQPDGQYYDAPELYNTSNEEYLDIDFDARAKDKWVHRIREDQSDDFN